MGETRILREAELDSIGQQIEYLIADLVDSDVEFFELGYSFELWVIDPDVERKTGNLDALAVWSSRWHHQICCEKKAIAYAISMRNHNKESTLIVCEIVKSNSAKKIEAAIKEIESNEGSLPASVVLLILHNYLICAFWIRDTQQVYLIDCPSVFTRLHPRDLLLENEFLNKLQLEDPIVGRIK